MRACLLFGFWGRMGHVRSEAIPPLHLLSQRVVDNTNPFLSFYESYKEITMITRLEDPPTCDTQLLIILGWGHRREHETRSGSFYLAS